jgi:hypothetical protein
LKTYISYQKKKIKKIHIAGGLELIFVATKSKISRSILKIIAGWDMIKLDGKP